MPQSKYRCINNKLGITNGGNLEQITESREMVSGSKSRNNAANNFERGSTDCSIVSSTYLSQVTNPAKESLQNCGMLSNRRLKYGKQLDEEM